MPLIRVSNLDEAALASVLARQAGVVSRRQVLECGGDDVDIRRMLRRRMWARVHVGVYVDHTGPLTWAQRCWSAVEFHWPAALHRETALAWAGLRHDRGGRSTQEPIMLMVEADRNLVPVAGVCVERVRDARMHLSLHRWPPRAQLECALLKVAADRDLAGAIAVLADACQQRRTDPQRLLAALEEQPALPGRALLLQILRDVSTGAFSVLEQRYLNDVERAHGLPTGMRQARELSAGRTVFRDVAYLDQLVLVELDGRFGHRDAGDRWHDLDRDLAAAVAARITVRLGWAQVLAPCRVARSMAEILSARGWSGTPYPCRGACDISG